VLLKENKVIICVPVYKEFLSVNEKASYTQLIKTLKNYDITLVTHKKLVLKEYLKISKSRTVSVTYFDQAFFKDTNTYSKLLLSSKFYNAFENYQFILIYQLDAWVFKDELEYWCDKNYDYIGAPWFSNKHNKQDLSSFYGIGNGGLSLRKTSSHLKALNSFFTLKSWGSLIHTFLANRIGYTSIKNLLFDLTLRNFSHSLFTSHQNINEDVFWSYIAKKKFTWYRVPNMIEASKFSFEINAELLFDANNAELPFGCHAWEIYDNDFWKKHINIHI
jgi:hypothetical protein